MIRLDPEFLRTLPDEAFLDPDFQLLLQAEQQAWATFEPRPDQPERFDQQVAFVNSQTTGVAWLIGGTGAGTTSTVLWKVARFVLGTPAPRVDTPFWIIANTYEQVTETCWKEKLWGKGFIPDDAIDWDRVSWYKSTMGLPYTVPIKPQRGERTNWVLEFKSYEQGRHNMQARSIGGFAFIEQFPFGLLEEVSGRCREYNLPGSKFCEFTPIDPALSIEIEEMIENGYEPETGKEQGRRYLPPTWEIYRANTECAMEAGHVSKEWFEEFFGMLSDEMRETRLTGQFASYEGAIYKGFNPAIHLIDDERVEFPFPNGVQHRRAIDWGAGPENPFCALWFYRDGLGRNFIYDEYYSNDQLKTTVDHLKCVADRWKWPANSPNYGTTWADPADPDNLRIAQKLHEYTAGKYQPLNMSRAKNAVMEGIEHVRYLLKPDLPLTDPATGLTQMVPRLYIHKRRCPNLARQFRTYRWIKGAGTGLNPRDPQRAPLKINDHALDAARYGLYSEANMENRTIDSMKVREGAGRAVDRVRPMERIPRQKIIPGGKR